MNRKLVNSELDKYRKRGKGTYTYCDVGCDCNIAVNLLEENQEYRKKYEMAVADYEYEKSKNQSIYEYIEQHSNNTTEYLDVWEVKELLEILKNKED